MTGILIKRGITEVSAQMDEEGLAGFKKLGGMICLTPVNVWVRHSFMLGISTRLGRLVAKSTIFDPGR